MLQNGIFALLTTCSLGFLSVSTEQDPAVAQEQTRNAAIILNEIAIAEQAASNPDRNRLREDPTYRAEFQQLMADTQLKVANLAWELMTIDPSHARLGELIDRRWGLLAGRRQKFELVRSETKQVQDMQTTAPVLQHAAHWHAQSSLWNLKYGKHEQAPYGDEALIAAGRAFWSKYKTDERCPVVMWDIARFLEPNSAAQRETLEAVVKRFPEHKRAKNASGLLRVLDRIGKPVELIFEDAMTGDTVSMTQLRGKIVVLDFWATWCGPCKVEMPHMKEIYAKYKEAGVEFIGVSLDVAEEEGGLDELRKYVRENEIPWFQYYQGNGWDSVFSNDWGVRSIPALMVIDAEGNLFNPMARGKLEEILPKMLKK